jgi:hypothetical protein
VAETPDGIAALRQKLERRPRIVPPPRHTAKAAASTEDQSNEETAQTEVAKEITAVGPVPAEADRAAWIAPAVAGEAGETQKPKQRPAPTEKPVLSHSESTVSWLHEPVPPKANEPMANLAIRVRKSLDDRLADVIHDLRRYGVRSSKAEVIELLLAALPGEAESVLLDQLNSFRIRAPRP